MEFLYQSIQFSSVTQSCPTLCDPMDCGMLGLTVHHQLPDFTQTHVHWVSDAIQPSSSAGKESACNAGDLGSIPGLGRSPVKRKATHFSIWPAISPTWFKSLVLILLMKCLSSVTVVSSQKVSSVYVLSTPSVKLCECAMIEWIITLNLLI